MMVTTETIIGFSVPDELMQSMNFEQSNQGWKKTETTQMIYFQKKEAQYVKLMSGGEEE
jgi:hypothetical protein